MVGKYSPLRITHLYCFPAQYQSPSRSSTQMMSHTFLGRGTKGASLQSSLYKSLNLGSKSGDKGEGGVKILTMDVMSFVYHPSTKNLSPLEIDFSTSDKPGLLSRSKFVARYSMQS